MLYDEETRCRIALTTTTVWLDLDEPDRAVRYKLAEVTQPRGREVIAAHPCVYFVYITTTGMYRSARE